jgi:hypothetical protein
MRSDKERIVLIVLTADTAQGGSSRVLAQAGAESLDAARKNWWVGLRTAEADVEHKQVE